jgi:hypothetical protein
MSERLAAVRMAAPKDPVTRAGLDWYWDQAATDSCCVLPEARGVISPRKRL